MKKTRATITGIGGYVPDYVLSNKELESMVDTSDEWIIARTGIRERRILKEKELGVSYMGVKAVKEMLKKTDTDPNEIDLIIFATITPDMPFPATSNIVAHEIGAKNSFSFDISAACSGFLYALSIGSKYIESGVYKRIVIIGGDKMSSIIDYRDRTTCIIFGDGAGCVMLEPTVDDVGILDAILKSDGSGAPYLHMKAGGSKIPATHKSVEARQHYVYQEGTTVFKFAITHMAEVAAHIIKKNNIAPRNIDWLIPHQANKRIIDATADRMGIEHEKIMMNIQRYGNTTAGTIPLLLWDYEKKLKKGNNVVLTSFGGGFTWGAVLIRWSYDTP